MNPLKTLARPIADRLRNRDIRAVVRALDVDHLDFGCSKGGSLAFARKRLGGRQGLGIDIDRAKIQQTIAAGFNALRYDILRIPEEKLVRFVVMSHFLEHLPSYGAAKAFIRKACLVSREFVYIQQPYFDADGELLRHGLKLFWSDWTGHPNRMTSLELCLVLRDLQAEGLPITFSLHAHKPIVDSADPTVVPLSAPIDRLGHRDDVDGPKEPVVFDGNVFHELVALITMPGCDHEATLQRLRYDRTLVPAGAVAQGA